MAKKRFLRLLTMVSKKLHDAYSPKSYTWRMVMVPKPTTEAPYPCILLSLSNGHNKILLRVADLKQYEEVFTLSDEEKASINKALSEANAEADRIEEDMRLLMSKRNLQAGAKIVNTGTGEILAEAEKILHDTED
jgi:hypothetical protein